MKIFKLFKKITPLLVMFIIFIIVLLVVSNYISKSSKDSGLTDLSKKLEQYRDKLVDPNTTSDSLLEKRGIKISRDNHQFEYTFDVERYYQRILIFFGFDKNNEDIDFKLISPDRKIFDKSTEGTADSYWPRQWRLLSVKSPIIGKWKIIIEDNNYEGDYTEFDVVVSGVRHNDN